MDSLAVKQTLKNVGGSDQELAIFHFIDPKQFILILPESTNIQYETEAKRIEE